MAASDSLKQKAGLPREYGKLYQDQLYGAKTLSPLAVAIIDTPEFQRLVGLRQLGFSDVVYRGARHSRLEHSIGTYLICKQVMRRIVQNHERLNLEHPGEFISNNYQVFPVNSKMKTNVRSFQARWRGLMEVVSAAALLHDLGHVPFGHTLEDEFSGIYDRHDHLGGSRLYQMLFGEQSDLAKVFSSGRCWLLGVTDEQLREIIYLTLSWKEEVDPPHDFPALLTAEKKRATDSNSTAKLARVEQLETWYSNYALGENPMYQPFMSDIIGNTICSDLLDYLPRDRVNLGMEARRHERLQRYFTIRRGTLHHNEGYRMSIMVTRPGHGGQRRDVASSVLGIMRERFEMAEAVYYHHKKAAASAMLAKLAEIADLVDAESLKNNDSKKAKPRDDDEIYPAPWSDNYSNSAPPHMVHLSDGDLIDYLGVKLDIKLGDESRTRLFKDLQRKLHLALRYRRYGMYRTLLVIDIDLVEKSRHSVSYFTREWRGSKQLPDNEGRLTLEKKLAAAAKGNDGDVIVYCPDSKMQSKLIDARLEIEVDRILPLRVQSGFVYGMDVETLQKYYQSLWRAYIFVAPEIYKSKERCEAVIQGFCTKYNVDWNATINKARGHNFARKDEAEHQPDLPLGKVQTRFDGRAIFSRVEPIIVLNTRDTQDLRQYLIAFADKANDYTVAEQNRISKELDDLLASQDQSKARFNRPSDIKVAFEKILQPPNRNANKTN